MIKDRRTGFSPLLLLLVLVFTLSSSPLSISYAESQRISDNAETQSVSVTFANDDFAFVIKGANNEYSIASTEKVRNPKVLAGVNTAYTMLQDNAEFKKMIEFYKESYRQRFEAQKAEFVKKIADAEASVKPGKSPSRSVKATINYAKTEIQKIDSQKIPPLTIIIGQNPNETTSCMQPWTLEYKDKNGKTVSVPASILMQQSTLEGIATNEEKLWNLITLAHETGHMISDNTTGLRNVSTNYKDSNPYFVIDGTIANDSKVVEFVSKGDPMPSSHWFRKTTNSQTAFEEGFAEFSGSFFTSPTHDAYGIADDDFQATKMGYKVIEDSVEVKAELTWTEILKSPTELQNTEFFIAKVLHRVAMSYADPYEGYRAIVKVKSNPDFIKSPCLETFLKIFARENPQAYAKFKEDTNKEIEALVIKQVRANNNRMTEVSELISGIRAFMFAAGDAGLAERTARDHIAGVSSTAPVELTSKTAPAQAVRTSKKTGKPLQSLRINEMNLKLKSGSVTK
ncbi:MAG TPA: hypothetical protein PKK26_03315 [Candidatus Wallbacteria bacterium]|nr:hypothetical protein [Candidatus Wallbacteria bacterium]